MWKGFLSTDEKQWATLPLRIALGVIFLAHGGQKLFGWLGGKGAHDDRRFLCRKIGFDLGGAVGHAGWSGESSEALCSCCSVCLPVWAPYLSQ